MRNSISKTVTVTVNGKPWRPASSLDDAGPRDRVFNLVRKAGGTTVVEFGDGVHGARPPANGKITATYRTGGGASGNMVRVTLTRAATSPTTDHSLWVAIRNRAGGIRFEFADRRKSSSRKT